MKSMKHFHLSVFAIGAILAIGVATSCAPGNGSPPSQTNGINTNSPYPGYPSSQPGPVANGTLAQIPAMNFQCGPNCVRVKRSFWNPVRSLQGKRFDIAILPNDMRSCHDWRNQYLGHEIARQRPKLERKNCVGMGLNVTCSSLVSQRSGDWTRPNGEIVRTLPAGVYLVCASVDANDDPRMDDDEFFSETRVQINPVQYYPQQQLPFGQYPPAQLVRLTPASFHWDGSTPIYY